MKRLLIATSLIVLLLPVINGQINKLGNPSIRNYSPVEIDAADRNWAIVQDRRGVVYVGNDNRGVLEFDGKTWNKISIPNNTIVRSLAINSNNTVYVGAVNEFGYLAPDQTGKMMYHSLVNLLDESESDFQDIWKTHVIDDEVYFSAGNRIYKYHRDSITVIRNLEPLNSLFTFLVDNQLYRGSFSKGLMELDTDTFSVSRNGSFFERKVITGVVKYDPERLIIATYNDGLFLYDKKSGDVSQDLFSKQITDLSKTNQVYHATELPGKYFAFATLDGGILMMDEKGALVEVINKNSGLQDETIAYLYYNHDLGMEGTLWAALSNGVSSIEINSPLRHFGEDSGLRGQMNDIIRFRDMLFVATSTDVYYYETGRDNIPKFQPMNIRYECWKFLEFFPPGNDKSKLLVGTSDGVFEITEKKGIINITKPLRADNFYTYSLFQSKTNPEYLILGLRGRVEVISYKNRRWDLGFTIPSIKDEIRSIYEDENKNLWLSSDFNGVYRVRFDAADTIVDRYHTDHGLKTLKDIQVFGYSNRPLFASRDGFFRFDETDERFIPDTTFGDIFADGSSGVYRFIQDDENYWISGNEGQLIGFFSKIDDGKYDFIRTPFRRIPQRSTPAIFPDKNNIVWFGNNFDLFSFNQTPGRSYTKPYNAIIRKVIVGQDSLIFNGAFSRNVEGKNIIAFEQPNEMNPVLKYAFNNVTFEFAAPFFENPDNIQYSYMLEGFNNVWSRWTPENKAVYTNLSEGDYTFRVKAINVYGFESVAGTYSFTVLPPWSRSVLAFIIYFILAALFVWGIVVVNSRRLKREKIILEGIVRERTAEVVKQKDEIEKQRDMIAEQNKNITDSIEYARRIQTAILPPGDYIKELFPQRFILYLPRDIVSGDFYWLTKKNDQIISVAADCTGHGVPGGFMSMLGIAFLNEIVNKNEVLHANEILNQLREQVISSLHQTGKMGEAQDGMDVSLYILDHKKRKLEFSGANNPLIIIRDNEIIETKGDKMPIGIHYRAEEPFSNHQIDLLDGDVVYSFTDGYPDQFGGRNGKKFLSKNFKELLLKIHDKPMHQQREILEKTLLDWQGSFERVDDILVMGVRI